MKIDLNVLSDERMVANFELEKYEYIINHVHKVNFSTDISFQTIFNGFYKILRNETWRKHYYCLFEQAKERSLSFSDIITDLYNNTGNVEPSFSSKMYSTLNTDKPIWDKHVTNKLNLNLSGAGEEKVKNAIDIYEKIEKWYKTFLDTEEAKECILSFDRVLPEYTWISNTKKIDYLLWASNKMETNKNL